MKLRQWAATDLDLLHRGNTPEMTEHLGGPESETELRDRNERYLRLRREGSARMFAIVEDEAPVGAIGWWTTRWRDTSVYETGWFVVPEAQGRGTALAALLAVMADVADHGDGRPLTAFPSVTNAASNRLCERAGFSCSGTERWSFRGAELEVNVWRSHRAPPAV